MKKLLLALLSFAFLSAGAQTVEEVIQKYSTYVGGLEAFNKLKSAKFTGTFTIQGTDVPMTLQIINGKAARTDMNLSGTEIINVYNNGTGWKQNPLAGIASPVELTTAELNELKPQSMLAPPLVDYKSRGHKVELLGQEDIDGKKAYKVSLTNKEDARVTTYYINAADYSLIKTETNRDIQGQTVTVESWYSDIKEINGVKFYLSREQKIEGETFQTVKFENIELNVAIDQTIFDMPKK
jgi:hypothetical protein